MLRFKTWRINSVNVLATSLAWVVLAGSNASAVTFRTLLETDTDTSAGSEIVLSSFNSIADVLAANVATEVFLPLGVNSAFSVGGFAFDGSQYHILLESDTDEPAGQEIILLSYNSFGDLLAANSADEGLLPLGVNSAFSVGGFAFDGSQYHILLESDTDAVAGQEIILLSYNSFGDLLTANSADEGFLPLGVNSAFSVGGFTFDGSQYHILLESDTDAVAGQEIILLSYNSFGDLLAANSVSEDPSQLNITADFSVRGLVTDVDGGGNAVPEPVTATLGLMGLGVLGMATRRRVA